MHKEKVTTKLCFVIFFALITTTNVGNTLTTDNEVERFRQLAGCSTSNEAVSSNKQVRPPIPTHFPNAKIFQIITLHGGGDYSGKLMIRLGDKDCELNQENMKKVFTPINRKEDAFLYYLFIEENSGRNETFYVMEHSQYSDLDKKMSAYCEKGYLEKLQNRIGRAESVDDGYLLTLIGAKTAYGAEIFESKIKVQKDGTITYLSKKNLVECGEGVVY